MLKLLKIRILIKILFRLKCWGPKVDQKAQEWLNIGYDIMIFHHVEVGKNLKKFAKIAKENIDDEIADCWKVHDEL